MGMHCVFLYQAENKVCSPEAQLCGLASSKCAFMLSVGLRVSSFLFHLTLVFQLLLLPCSSLLAFCGLGSPFLSK